MNILLTGASGQVGWELVRALMPLGHVIAPGRAGCDLAHPGSLAQVVEEACPDVIINAAAYTAVDRAEQETLLAMTVNADAPEALARAARRRGALLVHYSTDYVFDGSKLEPYVEDDKTDPLNAYGRSKLAGERAIQADGADHLIFRTSWVYGARGRNFLRTVLRLASEGGTLRMVDDQIGAPTWSRLIAETTSVALSHECARRREGVFESAVLHLAPTGATSWHGFAEAIVAGARKLGARLPCTKIEAITTADYPSPALRPRNSRLDTQKLGRRYGLTMPVWEVGLALCLADSFASTPDSA